MFFRRDSSAAPPRRIEDPDFGTMDRLDPADPARPVHWEGAWVYPPTGETVYLGLPGDAFGPCREARDFALGLAYRVPRVLADAQGALRAALGARVPPHAVDTPWTITGFDVESLSNGMVRWSIALATPAAPDLEIFVSLLNNTLSAVACED